MPELTRLRDGQRGFGGREREARARPIATAAPRPDRSADVHDRPARAHATSTTRSPPSAIDGGGVQRVGAHRRRRAPTCPRARSSTSRRGAARTSVYVPGAVEPMLPEALSQRRLLARAGRERAAVTVELELHGAEVAKAAFYRSLIRSDERLSYERVDRDLRRRASPRASLGRAPLQAAREAAAALERRREERSGALTLDSAEPEFVFDERRDMSIEVHARADRVPSPDRAPDDRRQRSGRAAALRARRRRACIACTSGPSPSA